MEGEDASHERLPAMRFDAPIPPRLRSMRHIQQPRSHSDELSHLVSRIAVDAMGGDRAPEEVVFGAVDAAQNGLDVVLVGDADRIRPLLEVAGADVPVVHASEVIGMADDPAAAMREKKDASVSVAARLVSSGEAQGLVSAGSTGGAMAASAFIIGRLPGVSRPAIATLLPTKKVVLDSGANLAARSEHLAQFAVMGSALASSHLGLESPRVGLLNIGEEVGKGRDLEKDAYNLIASLPGINFVGNVEGRDLATSVADVFVTDGFTGNVFLKTAEGVAVMLQRMLSEAIAGDQALQSVLDEIGPALNAFRRRLDPEGVGGAHLLGVAGVVVIAHGSSSRFAVSNAIAMAAEGADDGLPAKIEKGLATTSAHA
jgi:glycerol-3-phosphate acyltransferase PlsX